MRHAKYCTHLSCMNRLSCRGMSLTLCMCLRRFNFQASRAGYTLDRVGSEAQAEGSKFEGRNCSGHLWCLFTFCLSLLALLRYSHGSFFKWARGGLMVRNFDSYAYACGFESGLGHGAYGTLGKSPHPVVLCPVSPTSEDACAWC